MFEERRKKAMASFVQLLAQPETRMTVEDQYDELLKMADTMGEEGLISDLEYQQLIRDAGGVFARTREGLSVVRVTKVKSCRASVSANSANHG